MSRLHSQLVKSGISRIPIFEIRCKLFSLLLNRRSKAIPFFFFFNVSTSCKDLSFGKVRLLEYTSLHSSDLETFQENWALADTTLFRVRRHALAGLLLCFGFANLFLSPSQGPIYFVLYINSFGLPRGETKPRI